MQTVQRISAVLLCLVFVCLAASCGRSEKPSDVSLTPTQDDLDRLCKTLKYIGNYDSTTDNALDFLYDDGLLFGLFNFENLGVLVDGENLLRNYENLGKEDPLGYFEHTSYVSVQADVLDGIMENVFCNTVYKNHTLSRDVDGKVRYYLYDGWYHFSWEISGGDGEFFRADEYKEADGHLLVTLNGYEPGPDGDEENAELFITQVVDTILRETDGVRTWSIFSSKITFSEYANSDS